jgi:hypothetical protein
MVRSVAIALTASCALVLSSCGGGGSAGGGNSYSYQNIMVTITPQISSLAVSGTQTFTASVTNAAPLFTWLSFGSAGNISQQQNSGNQSMITFTAPSAPPVYSQTDAGGNVHYNDSTTQGIVVLTAEVPNGVGSFTNVSGTVQFPIIGTVSAGIAPTTASVKIGGNTLIFTGYCVGASSNTIVWQVNGVTGGSSSAGTIAASAGGAATYTAPATMPMTGSTVTVGAACQVDATKHATSTVTLTQ